QSSFERVAGYSNRPMAFTDGQVAERVTGKIITWTYFGVLGVKPAIGRDFTESDGRPGAPQSVIVSAAFWRNRLQGRSDAIGAPVRLDGTDYTLVGVLPERVGPLEQTDEFFVAAQYARPSRKGPFFIWVLARLKPNVDRIAALNELRAINRRIFPIWRSSYQD